MFHFPLCLLTLVVLQPNLPADQRPNPGNSSVFIPPNLFLVKTRTTQVTKGLALGGTFVITHVYAGSDQLMGKHFECYATMPVFGGTPDKDARPVMFFEKGTDGLWWLYTDPKDGTLRPQLKFAVLGQYQIGPFPYLKMSFPSEPHRGPYDVAAEYKKGQAWAEAVETVYRAQSDAERQTLLRRLAATAASPAAGWAMAVLGEAKPKETTEFLQPLVDNDKLSLENQVSLDRVLCRIDRPGWRASDRRRRLLERWLNAGAGNSQLFAGGCERLLEGLHSGDLGFALYSQVLNPVLARADRLSEVEVWWPSRTLRELSPVRAEDRKAVFDWLVPYIRQAKLVQFNGQANSSLLRTHAAAGLQALQPLKPAELETVRALRQEAADTWVQKELDVVLDAR